jgi:hypothetical protein
MIRVIFGDDTEGICDELEDEEFDRLYDLAKRGYIRCWLAFQVERKPVYVNIIDVKKLDLPTTARKATLPFKMLPEDAHLVSTIEDMLNGRR